MEEPVFRGEPDHAVFHEREGSATLNLGLFVNKRKLNKPAHLQFYSPPAHQQQKRELREYSGRKDIKNFRRVLVERTFRRLPL